MVAALDAGQSRDAARDVAAHALGRFASQKIAWARVEALVERRRDDTAPAHYWAHQAGVTVAALRTWEALLGRKIGRHDLLQEFVLYVLDHPRAEAEELQARFPQMVIGPAEFARALSFALGREIHRPTILAAHQRIEARERAPEFGRSLRWTREHIAQRERERSAYMRPRGMHRKVDVLAAAAIILELERARIDRPCTVCGEVKPLKRGRREGKPVCDRCVQNEKRRRAGVPLRPRSRSI